MNAHKQTEVVIIGAGIAGLTAALSLREQSIPFVVLEARDRVGGRIYSSIEDGVVIDYGGQWVAPKQQRVYKMMKRFGLTATPTFSEGRTYYELKGRIKTTASEIPPLPPTSLIDMARLQRDLNNKCNNLVKDAPWDSDSAAKLDAQTIEAWLDRFMYTKYGKAFYTLMAEEALCGELNEFSMLDLVWGLASCGGLNEVMHAEDYWITEGAQSLPLRMAASLEESIVLNAPVRKIEWTEKGAQILTDNDSWSCRRVILAIPPMFSGRIQYEPPLPFMRDQLSQRVGMGAVFKFIIVYAKPFWRDLGLNGTTYLDKGIIKTTIDSSTPGQDKGVITAFATGKEARDLGQLSPEERQNKVLQSLASPFGSKALSPIACYEHDWLSDPWARGGYGAHFAPGVLKPFGASLSKPVGPLHWAGTETATEWRLYMEGAMQSGERSAAEVVQALSALGDI